MEREKGGRIWPTCVLDGEGATFQDYMAKRSSKIHIRNRKGIRKHVKINADISSFHHGPPLLIVKWITQIFTTLGVPKRAGQDGDPEMWDEEVALNLTL